MTMPSRLLDKLKSSDIARRMANGAFWSFTGTALGKFLVLLSGIFCARILGQEVFGELGMVRSTIGMFIVLGTSGIGVTATRYIANYRKTDPEHAASICLLSNKFAWWAGLLVGVLMLLLSGVLATEALHSSALTTAVQLGAVMLFVSILNGAPNGILVGLEDFRSVAINTFIGSLCEAVFMVIGAWLYQLEGAILGFGIGVVALYVANSLSVSRDLNREHIVTQGKSIRREDWRLLYTYSIPATLSALTVAPVFFVIRSMLVSRSGYAELGIFEAADQWKVIILFIPTTVSQIVLPILSSLLDVHKFKKTLGLNILLIAVVSTVIALAVALLSPLIMPLYGQTFTDLMPLTLLAVSTIFSAVSNVIEMSIYSRDKMWTCFGLNLVWAALLIGLSELFLSQGMGASALALAVLLSYLLKTIYIGIYMMFLLKKDNRDE